MPLTNLPFTTGKGGLKFFRGGAKPLETPLKGGPQLSGITKLYHSASIMFGCGVALFSIYSIRIQ